MLRLGQMQCPHVDRERLLALVVRYAQAVLLHLVDMGRPHVEEGHILSGLHHMRPGIAADRSDADDCDFLAHPCSPACAVNESSAILRCWTIGPDPAR